MAPTAPVLPTPILLDTFTAANGTDPTTRDLDAFPAGAARWTTLFSDAGVIESNALQAAVNDAYIYVGNPGGASFTGSGVYCLLADITATDAISWVGPVLYTNSGTTFAQVNLQRYAGKLYVYAQGNGGPSSPDGTLLLEPSTAAYVGQQIKCALHVDGDAYSVIINGAVVASATKTFSEGVSVDGLIVEIAVPAPATPKPSVGRVGAYQNITLAEALSLTA